MMPFPTTDEKSVEHIQYLYSALYFELFLFLQR